jgi:hypothetical protein
LIESGREIGCASRQERKGIWNDCFQQTCEIRAKEKKRGERENERESVGEVDAAEAERLSECGFEMG